MTDGACVGPSRRALLTACALATAGAAAGCGRPVTDGVAPGTTLGSTFDVPVAAGVVFRDAGVVVTQPSAGRYEGFSAVCTHQGCLLQDVSDGTINCACHGSRFGIEDGRVVNGPAQRPLARVGLAVDGGAISVA